MVLLEVVSIDDKVIVQVQYFINFFSFLSLGSSGDITVNTIYDNIDDPHRSKTWLDQLQNGKLSTGHIQSILHASAFSFDIMLSDCFSGKCHQILQNSGPLYLCQTPFLIIYSCTGVRSVRSSLIEAL